MIRQRLSFRLLAWSTVIQWMILDNASVNSFSTATPSTRFVVSPPIATTPNLHFRHNAASVYVMKTERRQHFNTNQYVSSNMNGRTGSRNSCSMLYVLPSDISSSSTIWTSVVEYFDGSTIIDPVVVSNVFWSRLQANFISVIIGQFLAAIAFSFLLSLAASQITKFLSYVTEQIFPPTTTQRENQSPLRIPRNLRDDSSTSAAVVQPDIGKLLICILIDTIGSSSMLLPLIGDASDVFWAPTAGLLLRYLFYNSNVILIFEFAEEILPFTDIIPLATLCWVVDTYFRETDIAKLLQLGAYASSSSVTDIDRSDAIDIDVDSNIRDGRSNRKLDRK